MGSSGVSQSATFANYFVNIIGFSPQSLTVS